MLKILDVYLFYMEKESYKFVNDIRGTILKKDQSKIVCELIHEEISKICNDKISNLTGFYDKLRIIIKYFPYQTLFDSYHNLLCIRLRENKIINTKIELDIVKKIGNLLTPDQIKILNLVISDASKSILDSKIIKKSPVVIESDKLAGSIINNSLIDVVLFKKKHYDFESEYTDIIIELPPYLQGYVDVVKSYYRNKGFATKFDYLLSAVTIDACFDSSEINITCNIFQAAFLLHPDNLTPTTINQFSNDVGFSIDLTRQIFVSLFRSNIIIKAIDDDHSLDQENIYEDDLDNVSFVINKDNYTEGSVDIRSYFD